MPMEHSRGSAIKPGQTITVSLPPSVFREVERVRKREGVSRSQLVEQALHRYLSGQYPVFRPTKADLAALRRARAEIKAGRFVTLDQLRHDLDAADRKPGRKRAKKNSR